jgi:Protein of unknown function (DUF3574)
MLALPHVAPPDVITLRRVLAVLLASVRLVANAAPVPSRAAPAALEPPAVCVSSQGPAATGPTAVAKRDAGRRFAGDAFVRTELFFGSERPGLPEVSVAEFKEFLDVAVTPCFPDGLTLLTGKGQFRESDGQIVQETSFVLVLLYPRAAREESDVRIEALRTLYKDHFLQQSVLRVDDPRAVRVGF